MAAVGVLASEGGLEALPLDDDDSLDASNPRLPGGVDADTLREQAIVRRALAAIPPEQSLC